MAGTPMPSEPIRGSEPPVIQETTASFWGRNYVPPKVASIAAPQFQKFPIVMYHPDPNWPVQMQVANDEAEYKLALDNGWEEKPSLRHREMLQHGDGGKSGKTLPTAGSPDPSAPKEEVKVWGDKAPQSSVDLSELNKKELIAHAKDVHGLELDPTSKRDELVAAIEKAQEEKK